MLTKKIKADIIAHANDEYPRECCGVIADGVYYQCRNIAPSNNEAQIHPRDLDEFEGKIEAFVHSHPDASCKASDADLVQMEFFGKPYVIIGLPNNDFGLYAPTGYKAPLIGRKFFHGVLDCYALVKDFYERELSITLDDFDRADRWWEDPEHESLYLEHYESQGFTVVTEPRYGDIILTTVGDTQHVNHALVYLGDQGSLKSEDNPALGTRMFIHHLYGRKSNREVYGEYWEHRTHSIIRHRSML